MPRTQQAVVAAVADPMMHPERSPPSRPPEIVARFRLAGQALAVVGLPEGLTAAGAVGTLHLEGRRYAVHALREEEPTPPDPIELLTTRELEVATLVAAGFVNKRIARRLGISMWTVAAHLNRAFIKHGVHTRAEMAVRVAARFPRP